MNCHRGPVPPNTRDRAKWLRLSALPARDAQDERVQRLAIALKIAAGESQCLFVQLCHTVARDGVPYRSDVARVGHEDIAGLTRPYADPLEALKRPDGDDCDTKARLLVALLLAGNLAARMVPWWNNDTADLDHVSAEVALDGRWVHCETILSRARLGDEPQFVPVERSTGKWAYT